MFAPCRYGRLPGGAASVFRIRSPSRIRISLTDRSTSIRVPGQLSDGRSTYLV